MDPKLVRQYFEKVTALMLASAGIDTVEKQALHLLAGEAERYAKALGSQASRLAEASRRSHCTVADIETAAKCLGRNSEEGSKIVVSSDMKRKLKLSCDFIPPANEPIRADILLPQLERDSVETRMSMEEGQQSPIRNSAKRISVYPDWLQKEIEQRQQQQTEASRESERGGHPHRKSHLPLSSNAPLSFVSGLVMAEEESREILTKKLRKETPGNTPPSNRKVAGNS
jgi:histone H3/H4